MKNLLFLLGTLPFFIFSPLFSETISIAADPWMPFTGDSKSEKPGYLIEIAKAVFEPQGIKIDYQTLSWPRAIEEARKGVFTAIAGAYRSDAPDFIFSSKPQGILQDTFYVLKGNTWRFKDYSSLDSVIVGVTKGYSYGEEMDAYVRKNFKDPKRIQSIFGDEPLYQNLMKLRKGRIDVLLEGKMVVDYMMKDRKLDLSLEIAGSVGRHELYIAFSPQNSKSKEYAEKLYEGVELLRKNKKLVPILEKYGVADWVK